MNMSLRVASAICAALALSDCASVDVRRVESYDQPGIRYWRPEPYVALTPSTVNGTTTCDAKLVMLPDKSEEYAVTLNSGLWGSVEADPQLQDGWNLTGLTAKADSKTSEVLSSLAALLKAVSPHGIMMPQGGPNATHQKKGTYVERCDGLYRVNFDRYTGQVSGFTYIPLDHVHYVFIPVPPPLKKSGAAPE